MGLVLNPAEIKSGADQMSACIEGTRRSYSRALETVQSFSENRELESESWDKMKGDAFIAHQSIVMGMAAVQDVMVQGLGQLVACAGEEYLDEDELASKIQSLTQECIMYEEIIKRLLIMQSTTILQGNPIIAKMIAYNRSMLNKTKMILEIMKIKLESLRDKAEMTATLFQDVGPLLQAIESAINDAEYYISGTGTLSDGSWKITIAESIKEVNENLGEWYVERALQKELGADIAALKEMCGEDFINQAIEATKEKGINGPEMGNEDKFVVEVLSVLTDCQVIKVNGKYRCIDGSGVSKELTSDILENKIEVNRYCELSYDIAQWYVANVDKYCKMTKEEINKNNGTPVATIKLFYQCDLPGNLDGIKVANDCSGYVWATLVQAGYFDSSTQQYVAREFLPGKEAGKKMQECGFTWHSMSDITGYDLQKGDILVNSGHIEIFYDYGDKDQERALTWGSVYDELPRYKNAYKDNINGKYDGIWRLEP